MVLCQGPLTDKPVKNLIRSVALAALLLFVPALKAQEPAAPPFSETLAKATLAVYQGRQVCKWVPEESIFGTDYSWGCKFETKFTCSATVIDQVDEHEYVGLTAGHCFVNDRDNYVADEISDKPIVHKITLVKFENDERYDYAIFTFHSLTEYPIIKLNDKNSETPPIGTPVININFSLGFGKIFLEGKVVSLALDIEELKGRYLATVGLAPGASGSAIVDANTHEIIGIVEAVFPKTQMPTVVIPTGKKLLNFMDDDSAGLPMQPAAGEPPIPPAPRVPTFWDIINMLLDKLQSYYENHWWL